MILDACCAGAKPQEISHALDQLHWKGGKISRLNRFLQNIGGEVLLMLTDFSQIWQ